MENLQDILDRHAVELNQGKDISAKLMSSFGTQYPKLSLLLRIAGRIKEVLVPQAAPTDFVVLLRNDLRAFDEQPELQPIMEDFYTKQRQNRIWIVLGSTAGAIAGLVGLIVWLRRRTGKELATDPSVA